MFAEALAKSLGLPHASGIVQANIVGHTGADGYARLARQPAFEGQVQPDADYVIVDDFVGMGRTLANYAAISNPKEAGCSARSL